MPTPDSAPAATRLLAELLALRDEFVEFRRRESPVKSVLLHKADNATTPCGAPAVFQEASVARFPAGRRPLQTILDAAGQPRHVDPSILDLDGKPFVDAEGRGIAVLWPAHRQIALQGEREAVQRLEALSNRAGELLSLIASSVTGPQTPRLLHGWRFPTAARAAWFVLLFELAWSGRCPLLRTSQQVWLPSDAATSVPYDLERLRDLAGTVQIAIPEGWLKLLPDAYFSVIEDTASGCADLAGELLRELNESAGPPDPGVSETEPRRQQPDKVDAVSIDVDAQTVTYRGRPIRFGGIEAWRVFLALWKNRPNAVNLTSLTGRDGSDLVRDIRHILKRDDAVELADAIHNQRGVGHYLDWP